MLAQRFSVGNANTKNYLRNKVRGEAAIPKICHPERVIQLSHIVGLIVDNMAFLRCAGIV
jgi:hypothetical protein